VKAPRAWMAGRVLEPWWMQTRTSGGSRETEQNELTVSPRTSPSSPSAVTTVTPAGKLAMRSRNSVGSIGTVSPSVRAAPPAPPHPGGPRRSRIWKTWPSGVPPGEQPAVLAHVPHPVCLPPRLAHALGPALQALDLEHRDDRLARPPPPLLLSRHAERRALVGELDPAARIDEGHRATRYIWRSFMSSGAPGDRYSYA